MLDRERAGACRQSFGGGDRQSKRQDDGERRAGAMTPARRSRGASVMRWSTPTVVLKVQAHSADIQDRDGAGPC